MFDNSLPIAMKSVKYIRVLTYGAITVVLLLQGIWIANVYQLTQKQLQSHIAEVFNLSVNRELIIRTKTDFTTNEELGTVEQDYETGSFGTPQLLLQDFFARKDHLISLHTLDTIFHSEIARQRLQGEFVINRLNPETGEVLETTDPEGKGKLPGAMASEIIPIRMNGSEGVQVLLVSPFRAIFRQMLFALILSLMLILFVAYALFFLMRSFTKERKLRQLQNDFSNALTHNMASPLQTIYQVNALMKNDKVLADTEKRNKYIDLAQQQIVNLQALTDRILTVARAEQSSLVPNMQSTDVTRVISQVIEKFSVQAKKEVHFSTRFKPGNILFYMDETMLHNAVSNLIDNAVKYSGETVEIELDSRLKENGLHVAVKDNGHGISTANLHAIFNKFERGEAIKRKEVTGFGLGLSYVKSVTEAHHGTVNLHSKKGEGTLFELFFPFNDGQPENDSTAEQTKLEQEVIEA